MATRRTIYITDAAEAALGPAADESLSGRINSILIRYDGIRLEACPALTEAEWCAVCDVLNGSFIAAENTDLDPARHLWAEMADSPEMGEKWKVDHDALVTRLRALSYPERVAVIEVVTRFWRSQNLNAASNRALLQAAGARVAE